MSELALEIADIVTNERKRLKGFRVLGVFPFYLKYITTGTHIKLCKIKKQLRLIKNNNPAMLDDFSDPELQDKIIPLINEYCAIALANSRFGHRLYEKLLIRKLQKCGHYHLWNLFLTIHKLDDPAFFLNYWTLILRIDNTLLKEERT